MGESVGVCCSRVAIACALQSSAPETGISSASSCFGLVVIFSILICFDLYFKVRTFGCWIADDEFDGEVIRAWAGPGAPLLLQALAHKITKQFSSNSSEYLGGGQDEGGGRLWYDGGKDREGYPKGHEMN